MSTNKREQTKNVIALFGAYGVTGHYFLQLALEAGYYVRALILPGIVLEDMQGNDKLTLVTGTMDEEPKIRRVLKGSAYVVCMLTDCDTTLQRPPQSPTTTTLNFVKLLYQMLKDSRKSRIILYQVNK